MYVNAAPSVKLEGFQKDLKNKRRQMNGFTAMQFVNVFLSELITHHPSVTFSNHWGAL